MSLRGVWGLGDDSWQKSGPGGNPFDDDQKPKKQKPPKQTNTPAAAPSAPAAPSRPSPEKKEMTSDQKERITSMTNKIAQASNELREAKEEADRKGRKSDEPTKKEYHAGQKLANTFLWEGFKNMDLQKLLPKSDGDFVKKVKDAAMSAVDPPRDGFGEKEKQAAALELQRLIDEKARKELSKGLAELRKKIASAVIDTAIKIATEESEEDKQRKKIDADNAAAKRRAWERKQAEDERKRHEYERRIKGEIEKQRRESARLERRRNFEKRRGAAILDRERRKAALLAEQKYKEDSGVAVFRPKKSFGIEPPSVAIVPSGPPQFAPDYKGPRPSVPGSFTYIPPPPNFQQPVIPVIPAPTVRPPLAITPSTPSTSSITPPVATPVPPHIELNLPPPPPNNDQVSYYGIPTTPYQNPSTQSPFQILGGNVLQIQQGGPNIQSSGAVQTPSYGYTPQYSMSGLKKNRKYSRYGWVKRVTPSGLGYWVQVSPEDTRANMAPIPLG